MQFGDFEFRFRWKPTLLLVLPVPLFFGLGFWQLERADQKREQARILTERARMPAFDLSAPIEDPEALRFRKLLARGRFEAQGQILIENRRQGNRIGFHVVTPLRIDDSDRRVLVNRGWIAGAPGGSVPDAPVPPGEVTVSGSAHIPSPPALVLHEGVQAVREWGQRWPYLTTELYAHAAGYPVLPVVILQDADQPGGFLRGWPRQQPNEAMHIGYAIQWFAFMVIALVLWLRLSLTRRPRTGLAA